MLDACVLYPAAQRDLFMWLAAGGAIRAHWTNQIHDEWMRNVARDYGVARSELEKIAQLMNRAAGDALISPGPSWRNLGHHPIISTPARLTCWFGMLV